MNIELKILDERVREYLPKYQTPGAAAMDLVACTETVWVLQPGEQVFLSTGIAIHIKDPTIVGIIVPRSGLGIEKGLVLGNGTGVIDSDYQGEIKVCLWNRASRGFGTEYETIDPFERIAQIIFMPIVRVNWDLVTEFSNETERGTKGFGHTGK